MTSNETITIMSDGGLKDNGGFDWVAARDDEILITCYGKVKGSQGQMSSFRSKATSMFSTTYMMYRIREQLKAKV